MKTKQIPEDFVVEEVPLFNFKKKGKFSVYKLTKKNMDLISSRKIIAKKFKISPRFVYHAGIKDKIAVTTQYVAIKNQGKKGNFNLPNISLDHVGFHDKPFKSGELKGNKFVITIRDLSAEDISKVKSNIEKLKNFGFPNYFDSQRFGEDLSTGGFVAKRLMKNDYENALRLFLASSNHKSDDKNKAHVFIHKNWGKWNKCDESLTNLKGVDEDRKIIHFLEKHPKGFVIAFKLINRQKKELMVSSYQSFLWNKCLVQLIKDNIKDILEVNYKAGKMVFYNKISNETLEYLKSKKIPMLDSKTLVKDLGIKDIINKVLEKEKISQKELKINKMSNLFFKERERPTVAFPENLELISEENDNLNPDRKMIKISFYLSKGIYATILIKALFL